MYIWVESYVSKSDTSFCRTQRLFNPLRQAFSRLLLRARWLLGLSCETWLSLHLIGSRALHFDILYFFLAIAGLFFVRAGLKLSGTESFSLEYPAFFFCCRNKLFKVIIFIVENSDITFAHLVSFKWMLTFLMNPSLIFFLGGGGYVYLPFLFHAIRFIHLTRPRISLQACVYGPWVCQSVLQFIQCFTYLYMKKTMQLQYEFIL